MPEQDTPSAAVDATAAGQVAEFLRELLSAALNIDETECDGAPTFSLLLRDVRDLLADRDRLAARVERAELALCAHLGCNNEELAAGFELGDAPDADPSLWRGVDFGGADS